MNERVILPNYTEVRYCGTKCYIVGMIVIIVKKIYLI